MSRCNIKFITIFCHLAETLELLKIPELSYFVFKIFMFSRWCLQYLYDFGDFTCALQRRKGSYSCYVYLWSPTESVASNNCFLECLLSHRKFYLSRSISAQDHSWRACVCFTESVCCSVSSLRSSVQNVELWAAKISQELAN